MERPRCRREVTNAAILCQRTTYREPTARPHSRGGPEEHGRTQVSANRANRRARMRDTRSAAGGQHRETSPSPAKHRSSANRTLSGPDRPSGRTSHSLIVVTDKGFCGSKLPSRGAAGMVLPFLPRAEGRPYTRRRSQRGGADTRHFPRGRLVRPGLPYGADGTASPHVVDRCVERQDR